MSVPTRESPDDTFGTWDAKLFQYGLGVIVLGLGGLLLPTFGWQLHRLRALGSAQWIVLVVAVVAGSGLVLWSQRRRPTLGLGISGAALTTMLLFGWLSFWRHPRDVPQAEPGSLGASALAGSVPLLEVKLEGSKSREDYLLLCELVKDCVPTAKTSHGSYREGFDSATGQRIIDERFAIGPVPDVQAMIREIRFGTANWQGNNTLLVKVSYPLPTRSQAFEKRAGHFLEELRSSDPHRQLNAIACLGTLEPIARREEIAKELMKLLGQPGRPPGVSQCLAKWGTSTEALEILARLTEENANLPELFEILSAISPDVAVRAAVKLLPKDIQAAESALVALGNRSESAVLAQAEHAEAEVREAVCRILRQIGTRNSVSALMRLSSDTDPAVASAARLALEAIGRKTQ